MEIIKIIQARNITGMNIFLVLRNYKRDIVNHSGTELFPQNKVITGIYFTNTKILH